MKHAETLLVAIAFIVLFGLCLNVLVPALVWACVPTGVIATRMMYRG
jgi:hypothetical protein